MSPRSAPCSWPLVYCGDATPDDSAPGESGELLVGCSHLTSLAPGVQALIEQAAVEYLWNWTGQRFGLCPITVRPCAKACLSQFTTYRGYTWQGVQLPWFGGGTGSPANPALIGGSWYNLPCGCNGDCSCGPEYKLKLVGPVHSIVSVTIDGEELPSSAYQLVVQRGYWLVRTDGERWPSCQDMSADSGDGTFFVTYMIGQDVPAGGQLAAGRLACEMAKAQCGDDGCQLPQRLQTITRQGVTTAFLDGFSELYSQGSTGIWMVDNWIASINGTRRKGRAVASPDLRPPRRTVS